MAGPIVFSVNGTNHESHEGGEKAILQYEQPGESVAWGWAYPSTFEVPVSGVYFFTMSFVREYVPAGGKDRDVRMHLRKNRTVILATAVSGAGVSMRGTATLSVAVHLEMDDKIDTFIQSQEDAARKIPHYSLTGFLIPASGHG